MLNEWQATLRAELDVLDSSLARLKRDAERGKTDDDDVCAGLEERTREVHRMLEQQTTRLTCAECGRESDEEARGWRAYLTGEEGAVDGVEIFCPDCAREEFGDAS